MDEFTAAYVKCAIWNGVDDDDVPLDTRFSSKDLAPDTVAAMVSDCARFQANNADDIEGRNSQAGYDFWLSRNHNGAGFWETSDWPEAAGKRLTESCREFGECHLYVGDDGKLHHQS